MSSPPKRSTKLTSSTLVFGSSIVRDFDSEQHDGTTVKSISGEKNDDLHKKLTDFQDVYEIIVLVVGGNDCHSGDDIDFMLSQYNALKGHA